MKDRPPPLVPRSRRPGPFDSWSRHHALVLSLLVLSVLACGDETPADETPGDETPGDAGLTFEAGELRGSLEHVPEVGATFLTLEHSRFPGRSIYQVQSGGLNFEHIMNGAELDSELNWFSPRRDIHRIVRVSDTSATVSHTARDSSWGIESQMTYSFPGGSAVDMEFRARPTVERFPLGYVAFMWASYMQGAVDQRIHFYGRDGNETGWLSLGAAWPGGFEYGAIKAAGAPELPHETEQLAHNIAAHTTRRFELPFFYGLLDGDGNPATTGDRMAYVMMFDQSRPIRLAMWNMAPDWDQPIDPGRPAWDWQYVIEQPRCDRWYGYRARMEYFPFKGRNDVLRRYRNWRASLLAPDRR